MSSKLPTFLHIPSPSLQAAYPPQTINKAGSGQGRDNSRWVKVHQSGLDETLPVPVDFSVFLNQPINPFMDSKPSSSSSSDTQARTTMYVQDSGVVMISTSGLPRQPSSKSKSTATSSQSSRESSTSRTKSAQSSSGGGEGNEIDDDWEVVYPDN